MKKQMTLAQWVKQEAKKALKNIVREELEFEFYDTREDVLKAIVDGECEYGESLCPDIDQLLKQGNIQLPTTGKTYKKFLEELKELRYEYRTSDYKTKPSDEEIQREAWFSVIYDMLTNEVDELARKELEKLQKKQAI